MHASSIRFAVALLLVTSVARADDAGVPIAALRAASTAAAHTFAYVPPPGTSPAHVNVAGDFNGWSTTATELRRDTDGRFAAAVDLSDGPHSYKLVVDGKWMTDPADDPALRTDDNYGGKNSGLVGGAGAAKMPPVRPDAINAAAVSFDPTDVRDCDVVGDGTIRLSVRAQAGDVDAVTAVVDGGKDPEQFPLARMGTAAGLDRFAGLVTVSPKVNGVSFEFRLTKPGKTVYVGGGRAYDADALRGHQYDVPTAARFATPDWAKHAVWYQIFPERFRNGDAANDPPHTLRWTSKWFDRQPGEDRPGGFYANVYDRRYGGDLAGVRQSLPYLRKLGVTALYLNPIFQAESLHKYDATDYRHVDEHLGVAGDYAKLTGETDDPATWQWTASDRLFLDLVADAHRQGFRVILDGVFNHTGTAFWAFQDVVRNGRASPYAGWFDVTSWSPGTDKDGRRVPFQYKAWDGDNGYLPAFKKDATLGIVRGPREHILNVARRWLAPGGDPARGIDGFRLDAPENVPHAFWVDFRNTVKSAKPDAYIDGEIWTDARPWLAGDQFDGVMNYQFAIPAQKFFVNRRTALPPTAFAAALGRLVLDYPFQCALVNQNLFDSHDTDRFASMFVNPDLTYDAANRIQDNGPHYDARKPSDAERSRMLQAVAFQMGFAGSPMIYYGDEAGMWGPDDPSDRQPMAWPELTFDDPAVSFDAGKFDRYRRLIAVRAALPQLQTGFYRPLLADDAAGTFAFDRPLGDRHAVVVLNRSDRPATVAVPGVGDGPLVDWLGDGVTVRDGDDGRPTAVVPDGTVAVPTRDGAAVVTLPAHGVAVLAPPK